MSGFMEWRVAKVKYSDGQLVQANPNFEQNSEIDENTEIVSSLVFGFGTAHSRKLKLKLFATSLDDAPHTTEDPRK